MGERLSVYTETYTKFVIKMLVNIKGKSESDVVNFILKDWIGDHIDELEKFGISVGKAKEMGIISSIDNLSKVITQKKKKR